MSGTLPVLLLATGLLLRLGGKLDYGLWYDEIQTLVEHVRRPLGSIVTTLGSDNNHPLYTVSAWLSVQLFSESAFALRLPAVLFGTGSLWVGYRIGIRVGSRLEALTALALLTFSYHHIWFSQNARGYTALLFFVSASTLWLLRALDGTHRRAWVWYGAFIALACYSHLTGAFTMAVHGLVALVHYLQHGRRDVRPVLGIVLGGLLCGALYAPYIPDFVSTVQTGVQEVQTNQAVQQSQWRNPIWTVVASAKSLGLGLIPGLLVLGGATSVLVVGALSFRRQDWKIPVLFLGPCLLGGAVLVALSRNLWPRFFFFAAVFFVLIAMRGGQVILRAAVEKTRWRDLWPRAQTLSSAAVVAASLFLVPRALSQPKQDFEGAMAYIETIRGPNDIVLTTGLTQMPYRAYYETDYQAAETADDVDRALAKAPRVFIIDTLRSYTKRHQPEVFARESDDFRRARKFDGTLGGGAVYVYVREGLATASAQASLDADRER